MNTHPSAEQRQQLLDPAPSIADSRPTVVTTYPFAFPVPRSDWASIKEAVARGPLRRTQLYSLIASGEIKSVLVKTHRHNVSGRRLVSLQSIHDWIFAHLPPITSESAAEIIEGDFK